MTDICKRKKISFPQSKRSFTKTDGIWRVSISLPKHSIWTIHLKYLFDLGCSFALHKRKYNDLFSHLPISFLIFSFCSLSNFNFPLFLHLLWAQILTTSTENVALCGNRISSIVFQWRWCYTGLGWALNSYFLILVSL